MKNICFVSSNEKKFFELYNLSNAEKLEISIDFKKADIKEIQSESLLEVAENKVKKAYEQVARPVIVEDDGLFINSLNGFPGTYSSFVYKTLGNEGILDLLVKKESRESSFFSVFSYCDGTLIKSFIGETKGHISKNLTLGGWGFDPIFIPIKSNKTFGQMDSKSKNKISHRRTAFIQFYEWYIKISQS